MTFDVIRFLLEEIEDNLWLKTTFDGRQPLMEDTLWWKATFDNEIWLKTTFNGRQPLIEATFDERPPLKEEDLLRKITFDGRWPLMDYDLHWKTIFDGRQSSCNEVKQLKAPLTWAWTELWKDQAQTVTELFWYKAW